MAPGAEPKVAVADDLKAAHMEDSDFSISKEEVAQLDPRIQKLVNQYHELPAFERRFGFRAPIVWFNVIGFTFLHAAVLCWRATLAPWLCGIVGSFFCSCICSVDWG